MNFLSHEIINARANIITCELNIQAYTDDLLEHNEALDELLREADEMESSFLTDCREEAEHRHMVAVNEWLQSRPEVGSLNGGEVGTTYQAPTRFYQMVDGESQKVEVFSKQALMTFAYGKKQPKKLSVQYREPVRKLLKLCKSVDFRDAYLLIDQLCEVDMKVITEGENILRDLEILQRVRKVVLMNSFKSKS